MKQKILNKYYQLLGKLASKYLSKRDDITTIGVTGSVGKTSSRMIIFQLLDKYLDQKIYTSPKNFNGEFGLSLSIFAIQDYQPGIFNMIKVLFIALYKALVQKPNYDIYILEYGIDHIGEMDFLLSVHVPDIGVFTKLDKVHCKQFGNPDKIYEEKIKLIEQSRDLVFLNFEDKSLYDKPVETGADKFFFNYSCSNGDSDISFSDYQILKQHDGIKITYNQIIRGDNIKVNHNLVGKENIGYIGVGLAILDVLYYRSTNESFVTTKNQIDINFKLQNGRFSILDGINDSVIIDSSYNASPLSMRKVLDNIYVVYKDFFKDHRLILVLGDMRELGDFTKQEHQKLAGHIHSIADEVYLVGKEIENTQKELIKMGYDENKIHKYQTSKKCGKALLNKLQNTKQQHLIGFKGSQNTIFLEEAIKQVLKNSNDQSKLVRQSKNWLDKKDKFFESLK